MQGIPWAACGGQLLFSLEVSICVQLSFIGITVQESKISRNG